MHPITQIMLEVQEAQYFGRPGPQPRTTKLIAAMLYVQEEPMRVWARERIPYQTATPRALYAPAIQAVPTGYLWATATPVFRRIAQEVPDDVAPTGPPADIGEAAKHMGIDPTTAGHQDWQRVLKYVTDQAHHHLLRSRPDWIAGIVKPKGQDADSGGLGVWQVADNAQGHSRQKGPPSNQEYPKA